MSRKIKFQKCDFTSQIASGVSGERFIIVTCSTIRWLVSLINSEGDWMLLCNCRHVTAIAKPVVMYCWSEKVAGYVFLMIWEWAAFACLYNYSCINVKWVSALLFRHVILVHGTVYGMLSGIVRFVGVTTLIISPMPYKYRNVLLCVYMFRYWSWIATEVCMWV